MKNLRKLLFFSVIIFFVSSCNQKQLGMDTELTGVPNRPVWYEEETPLGMAFIPSGSFNMGQNDEDVPMTFTTQTKTVTISAFWMDETEITNNEYRQFVVWVRDSTAMRLALMGGLEDFGKKDDPKAANPVYADMEDSIRPLNWEMRNALWSEKAAKKYKIDYEQLKTLIEPMYYDEQDRILGQKRIDTRKLIFDYYWVDIRQAAKRENQYHYNDYGGVGKLPTGEYRGKIINYDYNNYGKMQKLEHRSDIVMHVRIPVYPDTLVWLREFTYSYNEPMGRKYFWHPAYDEYPVVGVNWNQANAFAAWRTLIMKAARAAQKKAAFEDYRLPTEAEWEYAARGGLSNNIYPWGGPYARNIEGCLLANFKPVRGQYNIDGASYTWAVGGEGKRPNDFGLYDMAGNVAEWTADAYDEIGYVYMHDMNPTVQYRAKTNDPVVKKRKVIRGGSWKDIAYYLQCGVRSYEYQDTAKAYIGFRCVRSYMTEVPPLSY